MKRLILLVCLALPSASVADDNVHWYQTCLTSVSPEFSAEHGSDWPNEQSCALVATMYCRFVSDPETCVARLDEVFSRRVDQRLADLPRDIEAITSKQKFAQTYLDFFWTLEDEKNYAAYADKHISEQLAWMEVETQERFVSLIFRLSATARARDKIGFTSK